MSTTNLWARIVGLAANPRLGWVVSAGYTLALVILGLRLHRMGDGDSESDFFEDYVVQSRAVLDGGVEIDAYRGPLYPILLAVLHVVVRPLGAGLFETGILLSALAAGAVILLTYRILHALFSARVALAASLLVVSSAFFVRYSYTTGNDMTFVAGALLVTWAFLRSPRAPGWAGMALVGGLSAVAYLIRYNGSALLVAVVTGIVVVDVWRLNWRRRALASLVVLAGFFLAITPWGLYCHTHTGSFFYNHNYVNVIYPFYLPADQHAEEFLAANRMAFGGILDVLRYDPAALLAGLPRQVVAQTWGLAASVVTWPVGVAALLGIVAMVRRRPTRRQSAFYVMGLVFFALLCFVFFKSRFNLFLIPTCATLAVTGIRWLARVTAPKRRRVLSASLFAGLLAYSGFVMVAHNRVTIAGGLFAFRTMGEWFVENTTPEQRRGVVVARKPYFAYFAQLDHVRMPELRSYGELMSFLDDVDARYLYFSYLAGKTRSELDFLTDPQSDHPGLLAILMSPFAVLYVVEDQDQPAP